jgi:hypothetical protein
MIKHIPDVAEANAGRARPARCGSIRGASAISSGRFNAEEREDVEKERVDL